MRVGADASCTQPLAGPVDTRATLFQRARQVHRTADVTQRRSPDVEPPRSTVGKRTLTQEQTFGAPDRYTRAIQAARRELRAVRTGALPAFIKTLRRKDLEPLAKQTQLTQTASQVRHLLMTANQHVRALEKAASYRDPIILFLRHDLDALAARATKLGIYRGAEDMQPRAHVEESKQVQSRGDAAQMVRKPDPAKQRMQAFVARDRVVAAPPGTRTPPTSPGARTAVQRQATGSAYARDVHAVAARGVEGASQPLPFAAQIQRAFGRHDVSTIRVSIGGAAAKAAQQLGANAYATGDTIAFASAPDLHTAAHEAAHVVQQRRGASPTGGIDAGSHDALERQADAVADSVVAGGSVEALLDSIACGTETRSVQRKEAGTTEPDTKYTFRRKSERRFNIGAVPAKIEMRWEVSLKDKGSLRHGLPGPKNDMACGNNQVLLESSAKGLDAKVSTSVSKATFDLLADGKLPGELAALPLTAKVEIKGLEGGLSIRDGMDLKLMTLAVYLDGDFSGLFDESKRSFLEAKGQVRIECALEPGLAKQLIELARASDAITRSAKLEATIAKKEKWLSYWKTRGVKDKVKQLEKELTKLRGVRGAVTKARDAGLQKMKQIGLSLEKSAGGRLLKKFGGKALATAFKKFLPIYNLVSTAQDLYEAGEFLAGLDWANVGDRIVNGGPGGSVMGDGGHDEGNGVGAGFGDGGEEDLADADAISEEMKREANVELHSKAQTIVGIVEARTNNGSGTQSLSKEDKETINFVVPPDLTPYEIEVIQQRLTEVGVGTRQDLVTTVVEAMQQLRPFGQQVLGPPKEPPPAAPANESTSPNAHAHAHANAKAKAKAKADRKRQKLSPKKHGNSAPVQTIIAPDEVLSRVVTVDEDGKAFVPSVIAFPGFDARAELTRVAPYSYDTGDSTTEASFKVKVKITPIKPPIGLHYVGGVSIQDGIATEHMTIVPVRRRAQQGTK